MLGYFICFYFTVNPGQIAIWDSGFLIEVYSTLCQALGQCRWAKKVNEKRKKHGSSENESERKTAGREKGRASKHLFRPLPRPPHVNMSKFARVDSREFAGWTSYEQCFPRWAIVSFEDRQALKELYDMSPDVLRTKVPRVSLFTAKFVVSRCAFCKLWRDFGFPDHNSICRKNKTENNSWLFKYVKQFLRIFN